MLGSQNETQVPGPKGPLQAPVKGSWRQSVFPFSPGSGGGPGSVGATAGDLPANSETMRDVVSGKHLLYAAITIKLCSGTKAQN